MSRSQLLEAEDGDDEDLDPFSRRHGHDEESEADHTDNDDEDQDMESALEASDDEDEEAEAMRGKVLKSRPGGKPTDGASISDTDSSDEAEDDGNDDSASSTSLSSNTSSPPNKDTSQVATLRKMMQESQKTIISTISHATAADADKGRAVLQQRKTFDGLLNTRIRLQKALVATNSLPLASIPTSPPQEEVKPSLEAAEAAALDLWKQLHTLRTPQASLKRKRSFDSSTPLSTLWNETASLNSSELSSHRSIVDKWARKTRATTTTTTRLNNKATTEQPLSSILNAHLQPPSISRLIAQTRVPRSCAPLQSAETPKSAATADENDAGGGDVGNVFDDSGLYQSLLTTLIAQRTDSMSLSATSILPSAGSLLPKVQKQHRITSVKDKRASKGRRLRYDVHEKLRDFMAVETSGVGWWEEGRARELFAGLMGGSEGLAEGEQGEDDMREDEDGAGALRLFA